MVFRKTQNLGIVTMFLILLAAIAAVGANVDWKADLKDVTWQEVISQGGMHIGSGRNKRFVELDYNQVNKAAEPCTLPSNEPGVCKPIHQCMQEEFKKDFMMFADYLCILDNSDTRKVGACCPDKSKLSGPDGLAGDLPATAPRDEENDVIAKITRSENRGCGLSTRPHARVMGSRPANPREWPWMASITPIGFEQYCGGVLITDRHILTAAHCLRRWDADELEVRLGEYDFKRSNDTRSYNFKVVEKRVHLGFDSNTYQNDIAILKLNRPAAFNTYVWPICLPPPGLKAVNESAVIIGWGTQWYGGPHSHILMEVSVPIWDQQTCRDSFTDSVFDENICAGGYSGGKDACQGDSGGPLMYQMSSGRWAAIGVVSWGVRCGEPNHPGMYTRVDKYLQWIVDNALF